MDMPMSFYFSTDATILFSGWTVHDALGLGFSVLAIAAIAVLLEGLKRFVWWLGKRRQKDPLDVRNNIQESSDSHSQGTSPLLRSLQFPPSIQHIERRRLKFHIAQSLLHVLEVVGAYCLMLVVMTYNGWLAIAVFLGAGVGYFVFAANMDIRVDAAEQQPKAQRL
ncbi:probable low affinity copper uptake protein 2 [Branchiostoma floridae]|uniref:Copper transport protein n=1 Tax=Branchiostoma floridae TaxID=7739 RepID=A0A9J7MHL6_BRAFL|nr:probable low affinity copper uptake protein 2 [Branchiostoma floridae]